MNDKEALKLVDKIEQETREWLKKHGYNTSVAHIHTETTHLQIKLLSAMYKPKPEGGEEKMKREYVGGSPNGDGRE